MLRRNTAVIAAMLLAASGGAWAQDAATGGKQPDKPAPKEATQPTLKVGDRAPDLAIKEWVKGEPVTGFEKGRVYVVEFWATWCGPCIESMPHLSELQHKFKDKGLTIIGVTREDPNNSLDAVKTMVTDKGDGMGYTVAWDDGRKTADAYMKAANQRGIPTAFLVDQKGTVAYIGHPMWLDIPLEQVVAGTWDSKAGGEKLRAAQKRYNEIMQKAGDDPKGALADVDAFGAEYPSLAGMLEDTRFRILLESGQYDEAYRVAGGIVDKAIATKNANKLNEIAWTIVDPEGSVKTKDLKLATRAAEKACEFTKYKDAPILDTLALATFLSGDVNKAIELQTKAVELAPPAMKAELEARLEEFKAKSKK